MNELLSVKNISKNEEGWKKREEQEKNNLKLKLNLYFSSRPSQGTRSMKRTLWSVIHDRAPWPHWHNIAGTRWTSCPMTPSMMSSLLPPMFTATQLSQRFSASLLQEVWNPTVREGANLTKTMEKEKVNTILNKRLKTWFNWLLMDICNSKILFRTDNFFNSVVAFMLKMIKIPKMSAKFTLISSKFTLNL